MLNICVLTGAGISAESGVKTFRDHDGLWEGHDVMQVATPEGFKKNPELVLDFYNQRRKQLKSVKPNAAHLALAQLEQKYLVNIITQNVDDLHERAGSKSVTHLHGELMKAKSSIDDSLIYNWSEDIKIGNTCEKNSQLRPHVVWFGEAVPMFEHAIAQVEVADIIMVVGTSMQVYPAASLIDFKKAETPIYFIDPQPQIKANNKTKIYAEKASTGVPQAIKDITKHN
ncbi:NAD-dependent deacetylase [Psychroflexus salarius]|uniref:protein acetyllysine N-acetyltransferase n=1 Tax=Psychroflexus salarius TaxID=1155689 RepID=A0A1M4W149_9FLAO|nr:NAD-dependent deacylase [Psychroflexus salarius]SHE75024.1 NAD-dependent deacetylase [Psychroflexus salarius]